MAIVVKQAVPDLITVNAHPLDRFDRIRRLYVVFLRLKPSQRDMLDVIGAEPDEKQPPEKRRS